MFGLLNGVLASGGVPGQRPVIELGIKDYGSAQPEASRKYLDAMADFVAWLQERGYAVRLLIGDIEYDSSVIEAFVGVLKSRNISAAPPLLFAEPALTVEELLRQVSETEAVISARYHNLVMALIQNKPVIALSDHAKLNSVVTDFGLASYLLPLGSLNSRVLIDKFEQLENDAERLKPQLKAKLEQYRQALDALFATLLVEPGATARIAIAASAPSAVDASDLNGIAVRERRVPLDGAGSLARGRAPYDFGRARGSHFARMSRGYDIYIFASDHAVL